MSKHIRHGKGSVRPYIYGNLDLPDFVCDVFGVKDSFGNTWWISTHTG